MMSGKWRGPDQWSHIKDSRTVSSVWCGQCLNLDHLVSLSEILGDTKPLTCPVVWVCGKQVRVWGLSNRPYLVREKWGLRSIKCSSGSGSPDFWNFPSKQFCHGFFFARFHWIIAGIIPQIVKTLPTKFPRKTSYFSLVYFLYICQRKATNDPHYYTPKKFANTCLVLILSFMVVSSCHKQLNLQLYNWIIYNNTIAFHHITITLRMTTTSINCRGRWKVNIGKWLLCRRLISHAAHVFNIK